MQHLHKIMRLIPCWTTVPTLSWGRKRHLTIGSMCRLVNILTIVDTLIDKVKISPCELAKMSWFPEIFFDNSASSHYISIYYGITPYWVKELL